MPAARFTKAEIHRFHAAMEEIGCTGRLAMTLTDDGPRFEILDGDSKPADDTGSEPKKGINTDAL